MFIATLFTKAPNWKESRCLSIAGLINSVSSPGGTLSSKEKEPSKSKCKNMDEIHNHNVKQKK